MKNLMGLGILAGMLVASMAQAVVTSRVDCFRGGCLVEGWSNHNYMNGMTQVVQCEGGDCERDGWSVRIVGQGREFHSYCRFPGCFERGWDTYDAYTQEYLGYVECRGNPEEGRNCLTHGWTEYSRYAPSTTLFCTNYDCARYGWQIQGPQFWQRAVCLGHGCFETGWLIEQ